MRKLIFLLVGQYLVRKFFSRTAPRRLWSRR